MNHTTHFDSCGCEKEKVKSEVFDAVLEKLRSDEANCENKYENNPSNQHWAEYIERNRSSILGTDEGEKK